jgi:FkbM family methyltransferase
MSAKILSTLDFVRFETMRNVGRPLLILWMLLSIKPTSLLIPAVEKVARPATPVATIVSERRRRYLSALMYEKFGISILGDVPTDLLAGDYTQVPFFFRGVTEAIDIGATVGDFSLFLVKVNHVRHVTAFEPNPNSYPFLVSNIGLNGCSAQITPSNNAVSDLTGEDMFSVSRAYLVPRKEGPSRKIRVACIRIDDHFGTDKIDLIKVDVEGSEDRVLRGAIATLRKSKPRLIIEVHSHQKRNSVLSILNPLGYRLVFEKVNQKIPAVSVLYLC